MKFTYCFYNNYNFLYKRKLLHNNQDTRHLDQFILTQRFNKTPYNSDGLIKCLRQRQDKFVTDPTTKLENSLTFIKFCGIQTVSSPGTASLAGGPTRWCLVFCSPSRLFHHDTKVLVHLSGLGIV